MCLAPEERPVKMASLAQIFTLNNMLHCAAYNNFLFLTFYLRRRYCMGILPQAGACGYKHATPTVLKEKCLNYDFFDLYDYYDYLGGWVKNCLNQDLQD